MLDSESPYSLFTCQRPSPRTFRWRTTYIVIPPRGVNGFFQLRSLQSAPKISFSRCYSLLPSTLLIPALPVSRRRSGLLHRPRMSVNRFFHARSTFFPARLPRTRTGYLARPSRKVNPFLKEPTPATTKPNPAHANNYCKRSQILPPNRTPGPVRQKQAFRDTRTKRQLLFTKEDNLSTNSLKNIGDFSYAPGPVAPPCANRNTASGRKLPGGRLPALATQTGSLLSF